MKKFEINISLNEYCFRKKDLDISYRSLNHYEKLGLIECSRKSEAGWRKFTGFDLIWINLIEQIRHFGVSLNNIRQLKTNIFEYGKLGNIDAEKFLIKSFQEEVVDAIYSKNDIYLVVFSDWSYTFFDSFSKQQWNLQSYKQRPHINLPLYPAILKTMKKISHNKNN